MALADTALEGRDGQNGRPTHAGRRNLLLAALSPADWRRWEPMLERAAMPLGRVLRESGGPISHAYFPLSAIVSLSYLTLDGYSTEFALVGREGIVGITLFMGGDSAIARAVVRCAGQGVRVPAQFITDEFHRSESVRHLMLRYTQALLTQMAQTAACNRHHSIEQQLCRLLLVSADRLEGDTVRMTQALIANTLGVRREGITEAALRLQSAGLIHYARGQITLANRVGLEQRSCECYEVVKAEYRRLLPRHIAA